MTPFVLDLIAGALLCIFAYGAIRMVRIIADRYRTEEVWLIETQRVYCFTCERHGLFAWHWHRKHAVGAPQ